MDSVDKSWGDRPALGLLAFLRQRLANWYNYETRYDCGGGGGGILEIDARTVAIEGCGNSKYNGQLAQTPSLRGKRPHVMLEVE